MFGRKIHQSPWALALAMGLGTFAAPVRAGEDRVDIDRLPRTVRHEIETATRDGSRVVVIRVSDDDRSEEDYFVRYLASDGREMKLRVRPDGRVLEQGPTREQRRKDEVARLQDVKTEGERARMQEELAEQREREDHERYEAFRAAQAHEAAEHTAQAGRWGVSLKDLSEEYNSTDRRRARYDDLPPGARGSTWKRSERLTSIISATRWTADSSILPITTPAQRRMVCRVDQYGKLLGKNELVQSAAVPVQVEQRAVSMTFEQLPREIRDVMRRETRGGRDLAFYRIDRGNEVFYSVHYTLDSNRRLDLWLRPDGDVVSRTPTAIQPGDRHYERDELGR